MSQVKPAILNMVRSPRRGFLAGGSGGKAKTFGTRPGVEPSTQTISRKCYFAVATGTAYTVPADTEITFDGSTWLNANGTTPSGAKWWRCRFSSSADYETAITKTPTLGVVNYPFTVTTKENPAITAVFVADSDGAIITDSDGAQITDADSP